MFVYLALIAGLTATFWLTWKAYRLGPIGIYAAGGVFSWGISGLLYFLATKILINNYIIQYVWFPLFLGCIFFILILSSLPRPKKYPRWLYALTAFPVFALGITLPYSEYKIQLIIMFILQLIIFHYAMPLWYALAQGEAPEGRAIWIPVLILFGSGVTIWYAVTPSYNEEAMVLATITWIIGLWLLVSGLELEVTGRLVPLAHLTGVAIGFMSMWMLMMNQWCLSANTQNNLELKMWFAIITALVSGLSIFLPLYLFKQRSERKLARWGGILNKLATFLWKQDAPTPAGIAQELYNLFRQGCNSVAGVKLAVFEGLLVGEETENSLLLQDRDIILGKVYLYDQHGCRGPLENIVPLASQRLGEVVRSLRWRSQAETDPLTGLLNRRGLDVNIHYVIDRAFSNQWPVTTAMLDIDYFKQVNDQFGHAAGDHLLQAIAKILESNLRNEDLAIRWGGEEFLIILSNNNMAQAKQILERIRKRISNLKINGINKTITISVGLAGSKIPKTIDEINNWIKSADTALRRAKEKGRNRVEIEEGS